MEGGGGRDGRERRGECPGTDFQHRSPRACAAPMPAAKRLPGAKYWRKLAPSLHVDDSAFLTRCAAPIALPEALLKECHARLAADGFFTLPPEVLPWSSSLKAMRIGVRRLIKRGWPASCLLVYDEVWAMAHELSALMAAVSGGCTHSLDTLAWSVTPAAGQAGFAPHRDRQPADVAASFRADGTPKYCTAWVALSAATTENSCLYLVPRQHDPGYDAGDDHRPEAEDPLIRLLRSDQAVQALRACPLRPGGAVIFTHRAMHWGSKGRSDCEAPRVSVSFGHTDAIFEKPYFAQPARHLPFPRPALRIALTAAQLINYHERFAFGVPLLRRLGATFQAHKDKFTQEYVEKTVAEYMAACQDRQLAPGRRRARGGRCPTASEEEQNEEDGDSDDAALDDALDAMLDAQAAAEGNLFDDYDGLDEE